MKISKSLGAMLFALFISIVTLIVFIALDDPKGTGAFIIMTFISAIFAVTAYLRKW